MPTVKILLITHNNIGQELVNTAKEMLSCQALPNVHNMGVSQSHNINALKAELNQILTQFDSDNQVLILTDMFGATPSNIACAVTDRDNINVISGLNLPMLIRVLNYPDLSLKELEKKAVSGGQEGVVQYHQTTGLKD